MKRSGSSSLSSFASQAAAATSVPVLVLMVPSVEVVVEEHDTSRCHASYDAPEKNREGTLGSGSLLIYFSVRVNSSTCLFSPEYVQTVMLSVGV